MVSSEAASQKEPRIEAGEFLPDVGQTIILSPELSKSGIYSWWGAWKDKCEILSFSNAKATEDLLLVSPKDPIAVSESWTGEIGLLWDGMEELKAIPCGAFLISPLLPEEVGDFGLPKVLSSSGASFLFSPPAVGFVSGSNRKKGALVLVDDTSFSRAKIRSLLKLFEGADFIGRKWSVLRIGIYSEEEVARKICEVDIVLTFIEHPQIWAYASKIAEESGTRFLGTETVSISPRRYSFTEDLRHARYCFRKSYESLKIRARLASLSGGSSQDSVNGDRLPSCSHKEHLSEGLALSRFNRYWGNLLQSGEWPRSPWGIEWIDVVDDQVLLALPRSAFKKMATYFVAIDHPGEAWQAMHRIFVIRKDALGTFVNELLPHAKQWRAFANSIAMLARFVLDNQLQIDLGCISDGTVREYFKVLIDKEIQHEDLISRTMAFSRHTPADLDSGLVAIGSRIGSTSGEEMKLLVDSLLPREASQWGLDILEDDAKTYDRWDLIEACIELELSRRNSRSEECVLLQRLLRSTEHAVLLQFGREKAVTNKVEILAKTLPQALERWTDDLRMEVVYIHVLIAQGELDAARTRFNSIDAARWGGQLPDVVYAIWMQFRGRDEVARSLLSNVTLCHGLRSIPLLHTGYAFANAGELKIAIEACEGVDWSSMDAFLASASALQLLSGFCYLLGLNDEATKLKRRMLETSPLFSVYSDFLDSREALASEYAAKFPEEVEALKRIMSDSIGSAAILSPI